MNRHTRVGVLVAWTLLGLAVMPARLCAQQVLFSNLPRMIPWAAERAEAVVLGDVDGDGDPDLMLGGKRNRLCLNDGSGVFTDYVLSGLSSHGTGALALGDLDGGGDLDALMGMFGQNQLFFNLSRHLAWRALPRFDKELTIDIHGPPGEPWILGASMGTVSVPSPGWGTLGLDPADLIVVEQGVLDPAGHWAARYGIGLAPASVSGILVYGQALVGSSAGLTNRETFDFMGL